MAKRTGPAPSVARSAAARRGKEAASNALTVSFSVAGTATCAADCAETGAASFAATSGTVTIVANQTTAQGTVKPTVDTTFEPDEAVILTVTAGTGGTAGTPQRPIFSPQVLRADKLATPDSGAARRAAR